MHDRTVHVKRVQDPAVEVVTVCILIGAHAVRDVLQTIYHCGGKVLDRICLLLSTEAEVRLIYTALEYRVTHALVFVSSVDFGPYAVFLLLAFEHGLEYGKGFFWSHVSVFRRSAVHALFAHCLLCGVVGLCIPHADHFPHDILQLVEVIRGVCNFVGYDSKSV